MTLKASVDSLEGLSDDVKGLYEKDETSGKFVIQVDGLVPKARLDEFRNNNIELQNNLKKYTDLGVDVEELKKAKETQRLLEEKKLIEAGEIDRVVEGRVGALKKEHENEVGKLKSNLQVANDKLTLLMIDNAARKSATDAGVLSSAVDDVILRVKSLFSIKEGQVIAEKDGELVYGKDGTKPLSVDEYVKSLKETATHLFEASTGSGNKGIGFKGGQNTGNMTANQKIAAGLENR